MLNPISTVILTRGEPGLTPTRHCVETLLAAHPFLTKSLEILVVSYASPAAVTEALTQQLTPRGVRVLALPGGSRVQAANLGLQTARGQIVFLVGESIKFVEPTLQILAEAAEFLRCGLVGPLTVYPNGLIEQAGVVLKRNPESNLWYIDYFLRLERRSLLWATTLTPRLLTGDFMGLTRQVIEQAGLFDEQLTFACAAADYCLRAGHRGANSIYVGYTSAIHAPLAAPLVPGGGSPQRLAELAALDAASMQTLYRRWNGIAVDVQKET